jgi:hypothetical protein
MGFIPIKDRDVRFGELALLRFCAWLDRLKKPEHLLNLRYYRANDPTDKSSLLIVAYQFRNDDEFQKEPVKIFFRKRSWTR